MTNPTFQVSIENLDKVRDALTSYPSIAEPILQNAIVASQAILAKHTTGATVPIRTGYLVQNWGFQVGRLHARWYPKAYYAPFVEFGTKPHVIEAKKASVLASKNIPAGWGGPVSASGYAIFGKRVNHPGTRPNPFMERIVSASQPEVDSLFAHALELITQKVAAAAS